MSDQTNRIELSDHFSLHEFACPCCGFVKIHPRLIIALEKYRTAYGRPIPVESGSRCIAYQYALYFVLNRERRRHLLAPIAVPRNSKHMEGIAMDPRILLTEKDVPMLKACGFTGIGIGERRCHLDVREGPFKFWEYDY